MLFGDDEEDEEDPLAPVDEDEDDDPFAAPRAVSTDSEDKDDYGASEGSDSVVVSRSQDEDDIRR